MVRSSGDDYLRRFVLSETTDEQLDVLFQRDDYAYEDARETFREYDPINDPPDDATRRFEKFVRPTAVEIETTKSRLDAIDLLALSDVSRDPDTYAAFADLLRWAPSVREALPEPRYADLVDDVETLLREREIYSRRGHPFCRRTFKILRRFVDRGSAATSLVSLEASRPCFSLLTAIRVEFVRHLGRVLGLLTGQLEHRRDEIEREMSAPMDPPYDLYWADPAELRENARHRFFTGVACSGKSTLLQKFRALGWTVMSRGDIGTFAGKAADPAAVAGLHLGIEWTLGSHDDVIGDRGQIDNPLWRAIMRHDERLGLAGLHRRILRSLSVWANEPVLSALIEQRGVVFVETRPEECRRRMLTRATGHDLQRGRIRIYPILQSLAYYAAARLAGWLVVLVPYDDEGRFAPQLYDRRVDEISRYLGGPPGRRNPVRFERFSKAGSRETATADADEYAWAKSVGIYK